MTDQYAIQIQHVNGIVESIRALLEGLWNKHSTNPQTTEALAEIYRAVQGMQAALIQSDALIASLLTALDEMQNQRDLALDQMRYQAKHKHAQALSDLARYIGFTANIPPGDVRRVLELLTGETELPVSPYTLSEFFERFAALAREAFEEEMYLREAEAEYDEEVRQNRDSA